MDKTIDLLAAGRAGIDLNTTVPNVPFAGIPSFEKSVGGSPANIIQGAARLGLRSAFIGKVSGDGMGEYILQTLQAQGIEIAGIRIDRTGAKSCLALTEIISADASGTYASADKSSFYHGTYLYRDNTADMLLTPEEIDGDLIARSKYVLLSGTAFSMEPSRSAMFRIMEYAKQYGTQIVLDIDYRPFGWKDLQEASDCYQKVCSMADIILGNREEFDVVEHSTMPGNKDNDRSAAYFLQKGCAMVVVKDGANGSTAYPQDGQTITCGAIPTQIIKTFGSGDAYAAGLMYGILRHGDILYAMQLGSACASLVLQELDCAPAMPDFARAEAYRAQHCGEMMR